MDITKHTTESRLIRKETEAFGGLPKEDQLLIFSWLYQKSPHTRRAYQRVVIQFFHRFQNTPLKEIETAHILVFLDSYRESKPATRNQIRAAFSSLYTYGNKVGKLNTNPVIGLDFEKTPHRIDEKILSRMQIARMVRFEPSRRNQLLILLLYKTGLRISELLSLRIKDFKPVKSKDPLQRTCFITVVGKGGKVRTIRIRYSLWRRIAGYLSAQKRLTETESYIFQSDQSLKAISSVRVQKILAAAGERVGLDAEPSPHWFRHSNATHALNRGAPIHAVQKTLGHASLSTTSIYTEIRPKKSSADYL